MGMFDKFMGNGLLGMGGLGGAMGGGAPQGLLEAGFDPAALRKMQIKRALLQGGIAMLGQGPSQYPISFGQQLATGLGAGLQGADQARDDYTQQTLLGMQLKDRKEDRLDRQKDRAWTYTQRSREMDEQGRADDLRKKREGYIDRTLQSPLTGVPVQQLGQARMYNEFGDTEGAFKALLPQSPRDLMSVGADSSLYNPNTGEFIQPPGGGQGRPKWNEIITDEGVFLYDEKDPTRKMKIGDRPDRNEGEGRKFSQEKSLRAEFIKQAQPYTDLRTNYQRIKASAMDNTGASDIAMVYSFMKMLDPTSVVREGEFATAANAGGVDSQVIGMYNRVLSGERLAPQVRAEFVQQADRQFQQQDQTYQQMRKVFGGLAQANGLDPSKVLIDLSYGVQPSPSPQQSGGASGKILNYDKDGNPIP
jgi:hypothetical protein